MDFNKPPLSRSPRHSLSVANDSVTSSNFAISASNSAAFGAPGDGTAASTAGTGAGGGNRRGSNFSVTSINDAQDFQVSSAFFSFGASSSSAAARGDSPTNRDTPPNNNVSNSNSRSGGSGGRGGAGRRTSTSFVDGSGSSGSQSPQPSSQQHSASNSPGHMQQQQQGHSQQRREQQLVDVAAYFQQLKDIVPPIAQKESAAEAAASSSSPAFRRVSSSGDAERAITDVQKSSIRELLYHHACIVEALSAQLPVDVELSPNVLRSTAQNSADAARLRVDFLTDTKSALVAMRVLTHLAVLGGQRWRERQRSAELRHAEDDIRALRSEATALKQQLHDAHREIGVLQSVVNETRVNSHRQLMDSEMKRRELQDELTKQSKQNLMQRAMLASSPSQSQSQSQSQQQPSASGGVSRRRRSLLNASLNNDPFGAFESSMSEPPDFLNNSSMGGSITSPPVGLAKVASLSGIRDAWGGAFAQKQQESSQKKTTKLQQQQSDSSGNTKYGAARRVEDQSDLQQMQQQQQQQQSSGKRQQSDMMLKMGNPAQWLANQQSEERTAAIRKRASTSGGGGGLNSSGNVSFEEKLSSSSEGVDGHVVFAPGSPSFGPGSPGTHNTTRRRSTVSFAKKDGRRETGLEQTVGLNSGPGGRPLSGDSGRNKAFLAGVKDMLSTLVPERQRVGFAEEDALADLEEAEIIHGVVSDITGEAPSSDLKVVRNFGRGAASLKDARERQRLEKKRKMFGAGSADAVVPPILFQRPPQVPDSSFIEDVFRAMQSLQVGSFHGTDDRSEQAVVEPEQVVEYLNTHWPELEDLLGSVERGKQQQLQQQQYSSSLSGGGSSSSSATTAVVDFVQQHKPLHLRSFAQVLLHVSRM